MVGGWWRDQCICKGSMTDTMDVQSPNIIVDRKNLMYSIAATGLEEEISNLEGQA